MGANGRPDGALRSGLRTGAPLVAIGAIAVGILLALLAVAVLRTDEAPRAYAEIQVDGRRCLIDKTRSRNAVACERVGGPVSYRVTFTKDLSRSAPVASRGTCCPGQITVSVDSPRSVLVAFPGRPRFPIRAAVVVP